MRFRRVWMSTGDYYLFRIYKSILFLKHTRIITEYPKIETLFSNTRPLTTAVIILSTKIKKRKETTTMSKTRTERIAGIAEEIEQLTNRRRRLIQEQKKQERKDRTRRLCTRAGHLECVYPETIPLSDERFFTFLEKVLSTDHAKKLLSELTAQQGADDTKQSSESAAQATTYPVTKTADTEDDSERAAGGARGRDSGGAKEERLSQWVMIGF